MDHAQDIQSQWVGTGTRQKSSGDGMLTQQVGTNSRTYRLARIAAAFNVSQKRFDFLSSRYHLIGRDGASQLAEFISRHLSLGLQDSTNVYRFRRLDHSQFNPFWGVLAVPRNFGGTFDFCR